MIVMMPSTSDVAVKLCTRLVALWVISTVYSVSGVTSPKLMPAWQAATLMPESKQGEHTLIGIALELRLQSK
jgi:hypothetical protein